MYRIDEVLRGNYKKYNHNYIYERIDSKFIPKTYQNFVDDVYEFAAYLQEVGLSHKKIGIYSENNYGYMVADIAIMGFVGISVGLSKDWLFDDLKRAISFLDLNCLIYSKKMEDVVLKLKKKFPHMIFISMDEVLRKNNLKLNKNLIDPKNCSKIVFSSGTTGRPKAVMLSQKNMFASWENLRKRAPMNKKDKCYLFLPLHHTYGSICNLLYSLITGMSIYICSDIKKIVEELNMIQPTVFCAVPLIYEKLYELSIKQGKNIKHIYGGEMKYLFNGGAYLKPEIRKYIKENKYNLLEAYGLSESSSLISVEYSNKDDFKSVGRILEHLDLKIYCPNKEGVGEIIVKGENVFLGYYNNKEKTKKAFNEEGYFHTGDLGYIKNEKLYIAGRKKREIVLPSGKNINPDEIERDFAQYPEIIRSKVFEKEGQLFASLYVNQLSRCDHIVAEVNKALPKYSEIKAYEIIETNKL